MKKRKNRDSATNDAREPKRPHNEAPNDSMHLAELPKDPELLCPNCGSTNLVDNGHVEYCGDCGSVTDNTEYADTHLSYTQIGYSGNTISFSNHSYNKDEAGERLGMRWNKRKLVEAERSIVSLCQQMRLSGVADRAKRMFSDYIGWLMRTSRARSNVFDVYTELRIAACVYIAAIEDGRSLALIDVASAVRKSVFEIGALAKEIASTLNISMPLSDPHIQVTRTVDRLIDCGGRCMDSAKDRAEIEELIVGVQKVSRDMPRLLMGFLGNRGQTVRADFIRLAGRVVEFCRVGDSHTGMNPATVVGAAISLSLEHLFLKHGEAEMLQLASGQRQVLVRLVALMTKTGPRVVQSYLAEIMKRLLNVAKAVPWLRDICATKVDVVGTHLSDILFFQDSSKGWLFDMPFDSSSGSAGCGSGQMAKESMRDAMGVPSESVAAPAFVRAENRRVRRQRMISCATESPATAADVGSAEQGEASVVKRLCQMGADQEALLNLPLHTLRDLQSVVERQRGLSESDRRRLDSEIVSAKDMSDEEVMAYLRK